MDSAIPVESRPTFTERFPLRMIVFAAIVLVLLGYPVWVYLDSVFSGGVKDLGNGIKQVDLKAMSSFSFDQERGSLDDIPEKWRQLNGHRVVLYGEMWEPNQAGSGKLLSFDLCYSIAKCCFSGPPQVQHFVKARVRPNVEVYHYPNQVKVLGILRVNVIHDAEAGKVASVYQLDVEYVEPVR
jgi:hypothetical protein